jgi:pentatricopeptide repeat protein
MPDDDDDLKFLATATDDMQESLISGRLAEADIHCMSSRQMSSRQLIRAGAGARCDVYVRAGDLERARAVLKETKAASTKPNWHASAKKPASRTRPSLEPTPSATPRHPAQPPKGAP